MMVVTFKTFQSGVGDCIFLLLKQEEKQFSIMVDCGEYTKEIKRYVENDLNKQIDLLIVTHIDSDHIMGVETMLTTTPNLTIGKILFNCYQRDSCKAPVSLTTQQKKRLEGIQSEINSVFHDIMEQEVSAQQAIQSLSTAILKSWKSQWDRPYIALDAKNEISIGEWGTIKFLAPTMKQINALDKEFKSILFSELFTEQDGIEYKNSESIYEILIMYANLHEERPSEERCKRFGTGTYRCSSRTRQRKQHNPLQQSFLGFCVGKREKQDPLSWGCKTRACSQRFT